MVKPLTSLKSVFNFLLIYLKLGNTDSKNTKAFSRGLAYFILCYLNINSHEMNDDSSAGSWIYDSRNISNLLNTRYCLHKQYNRYYFKVELKTGRFLQSELQIGNIMKQWYLYNFKKVKRNLKIGSCLLV